MIAGATAWPLAARAEQSGMPVVVDLEESAGVPFLTAAFRRGLSSETKCNTPADLIIGTADQDLRECCHGMLFAFVG